MPSPPGGDTDAAGAPAKTNTLLGLLPPPTSCLCTAPRPCGASRYPCLRWGFLPGQRVLHTSAQPVFMRTAASRTQFAPLGGGELTRPAFPRERTLSWGYSTRPLGFPNQRPPPFHAGRRFADVTCSSQRWGGLTRRQRSARRHPVIRAECLKCRVHVTRRGRQRLRRPCCPSRSFRSRLVFGEGTRIPVGTATGLASETISGSSSRTAGSAV